MAVEDEKFLNGYQRFASTAKDVQLSTNKMDDWLWPQVWRSGQEEAGLQTYDVDGNDDPLF